MDLETMTEIISEAGSADHETFGGTYTGGLMLQQDPAEFAELMLALHAIAEVRPIHSYLQIGSAAGGSERFICEALGIKEFTTIDLGDHPQFPTWRYTNKPALVQAGIKVTEWIGDSHDDEALAFLRAQALEGAKYDLIGIDGDHTPAGVRMDWELVVPFLRPGTLVWFHDTNTHRMRDRDNGPYEVTEKLKAMGNFKTLLDTTRNFGIVLLEVA